MTYLHFRKQVGCFVFLGLSLFGTFVFAFPSVAKADITTALVGYWNLDEGTGTSAADSINSNTGTLTNGPTWVAGQIGSGAVNFSSDHDDRIAVGNPANLTNLGSSTPMSVAVWVKPTEYVVSEMYLASKINSTTFGWRFGLNPGVQDGFTFAADYSTTDLVVRSADSSVQYGVWQHVVMTWDGSTTASNVHIYINGTETSSYDVQTSAVGSRVTDASFNFNIGNTTGSTRALEGSMDDVRVYTRALSPSDVSELYAYTAADVTAPVISSVASSTNATTATVTWTTNEAATSTLDYGTTTGYGTASSSIATATTSHSFTLSGLTDSTLYHFRASSADAAGNLATSSDYTFTTASAIDTTPPAISSVASSTTLTTATVTWTTNEAASSTVNYGANASYGTASTSASLVTSHSIILSGLSASTAYHFQVGGADASGNISTSSDLVFTTTAPPDLTAPIISSVASSTTSGSATITWTTNEAATSTLNYGTTISYGSASSSSATATTTHSFTLTGLSASTLYHFRASSADASGNLATSSDYTFTTSAADLTTGLVGYWALETGSGTSAVDSISSNNGTLTNGPTWVTGQVGNYGVNFDGTDDFISTSDIAATENIGTITVSVWAKSTSADLAGTQYIFAKSRSGQTNISWEITKSAQERFGFSVSNGTTKASAVSDSAFADTNWHHVVGVYDGTDVNIYVDGAAADATPGALTGNVSNTTYYVCIGTGSTGANCTTAVVFSGSIDDPRIYNRALSSSEVDSLYDYRGIDVTVPIISSIASSTDATTATITWTTNENATSTVNYGTTTGYGTASTSASSVTSHSIVLGSLSPSTLYHFKVSSADPSGNVASSSDLTFTTAVVDVTSPIISSVASSPSSATAVVTWTTNEAATSQVEYGLTSSYTASSTLNSTATTSHSVTLSSLTASTTYHFRVRSVDSSGNIGTSTDITLTTIEGATVCSESGDCITLQNGMIWVFLGDSITNAHGYSDYMESYFHLRYPELDLHFRGIGRGGSTIPEATTGGRYDQLVYALSPDVVSEMFGHNGPQDDVAFESDLIDLTDNYIIADNDALPVYFGPHPSNTSTGKPILGTYSDTLTEVGEARGYVYADIWHYLFPIWSANLASSTPVNLQGVDTVHPGPSGHLGIAYALLNEINAEESVSSATINAANGVLLAQEHASISAIATTTEGVDFTRLDERLPMAFDDGAREIFRLMPEVLDMNRYMLTVIGLSSGAYEVYVDNVFSGTTTASMLSGGWNMTEMTQGPIHDQLLEVLGRIRDKEGVERVATDPEEPIGRASVGPPWQGIIDYKSSAGYAYDTLGLRGDDLKEYLATEIAAIDDWDALIHDVAEPVSRNFSLRLVEGSGAPDTTAPSVSITTPANNATTTGASVTLTASASDDVGVSEVQFILDSSSVLNPSVIFAAPYSMTWDSTSVSDGVHSLNATAEDAAGNIATSSAITIHVDNAAPVRSAGSPSGTLAFNTSTTTLSLSTNESATCKYSTNPSTAYASMTALSTTGTSTHSQALTGLLNGGSYVYYAKCRDGQGNTNATDYTISFSVAGDTTFPTVSMTAPSNNASVSGSSITLSASASDDVSVAGVRFVLDDVTYIGDEDTSFPYTISWDSTAASDGVHSIKAVARDGSSNVTDSSIITVTVDNTAPVRSGASPTGTLGLYTTNAVVSLTTDESATCKYSTSPSTAYGSMTSFTTTGNTSHSSSIAGLVNGGSYAYYVKCRDSQSNTNASDYAISFSVAADNTTPTVVITSPDDNDIVSGTTTLIAEASDDVGVVGVQFWLDDSEIDAADTSAPYTLAWDSSAASEGSHIITAVAHDEAGNDAVSADVDIVVGNDIPIISSISSGSPSRSGTTITWTTNEPSDSQVEYGLTSAYTDDTTLNASLVTSHSAVLSGLAADTTYHFRVISKDSSNATVSSTDQTFTTAASSGRGSSGGSSSARGTTNTIPTPSSQTTTTSTFLFTRDLALNATGPDVTSLQQLLISQGYLAPQYVTGFFGPLTKQALIKYQVAKGIAPAIGYFGPITRTSVNAANTSSASQIPSTAVSSSIFTRDLQSGSTGPDVKALQQFLNSKGFTVAGTGPGSKGNETEKFGGATRAALIKFQKAVGIEPASGYFGPITRRYISSH